MSFNPGINDNQNFRIQNGRPSSRVLAPSGGHSSLSFGVAPTPEKKKEEPPKDVEEEKVEEQQTSVAATTTTTSGANPPTTGRVVAGVTSQPNDPNRPVSANAFASGSNINGAQVMTGRPTSRVLAPPGGHTSIKLG